MSRDGEHGTPDNVTIGLPSGRVVTRRTIRPDGPSYVVHGSGPVLTAADVEALYADSIAGDGGRELPERPCTKGETEDCGLPAGHPDRCVPKWFIAAMAPILRSL